MKIIFIILILIILYKRIFLYPCKIGKNHLSIFFGIPGSGKTTIAASLALQYQRKNIPVYSNVAIKGCYQYNVMSDLGKFSIQNCLIIIDEASIEMNSRNWAKFPQHLIEFFKKHRHEHCEIAVFSQDYQDFDATVKRISYKYYLCRPSIIPFVYEALPIKRKFGINDQTHKPDDIFSLHSIFTSWIYTRFFFAPLVWKNFNSWDSLNLPTKKFNKYNDSDFEKPRKYRLPLKDKIMNFFKSRKVFKIFKKRIGRS